MIDTAQELTGLAKLVNEGTDSFNGKIILLSADINLSAALWTPIGTRDNPFKGTFCSGDLYNLSSSGVSLFKITGLRIGSADTPDTTILDAGLFGFCSGAVIAYVEVDAAIYTAVTAGFDTSTIGGIVGFAEDTIIKNCRASGVLIGIGYTAVGGLAGVINQNDWTISETAILNSCTNVTANGSAYAGGLAGVAIYADIFICYAAGSVLSLEDNYGACRRHCRI